MYFKGIEWLSESGDEAIVLVSDGKHTVSAFCHPFMELAVGDEIEMLYPFNVSSISISKNSKIYLCRHGVGLSYDVCGVVFDEEKKIVCVEGILLLLNDDIPGDIHLGDAVEFSCNRIDI